MKFLKLTLQAFCCFLFVACQHKTLFKIIPSSESGVHFNNKIIENDSLNPIDVTNIYNGGGVGIGDFNNDSLQDICFVGNLVPNKLYLNKGNLKFEDITDVAGVDGKGQWNKGVSVIDINNDGWLDLYLSASMLPDAQRRQNLLYINQGVDKNNIPHFKEMAAAYGLNDTTQSTMASFFDYDNDGDLDMYLTVNQILPKINPSQFKPIVTNGSFPSTGRLYRNDWNDSLKHPFFSDVSKQAGITIEGYGHGATVADFNKDGWKDIYVSNDFISCDILYINNHDGTFTDKSRSYFKHTSANSMGQDVADINNDGLEDMVVLDMNPEDNYRKKTMMSAGSYRTYQNSDNYGYQYQYVRNTLQLNQGQRILQNDSVSDPVFSDISFFSGMAETDWSWTPMVADFDNDGLRDIIITNGFPKDVTDHDFIAYRRLSFNLASKKEVLSQIPEVKLKNYAYKNNGDLKFLDVSKQWGLTQPSFSNGAVYADLDNDGDLDMVVNNINEEAFLYKNTTNDKNKVNENFLKIKFQGAQDNLNGLGAWAEIYYNNQKQVYENTPYRGYLSSIEAIAFFGLGKIPLIDSVVIRWPNNKKQVLYNVKPNQLLKVEIKNANLNDSWQVDKKENSLFAEATNQSGINYLHQEDDYIDFNREILLPHKLSQYGPALAAADIDGNGLDDICVGGSSKFPGKFFLQQKDGKFIEKDLYVADSANYKNMGLLFFDADGDGDPDLYCANGSNEFPINANNYQDQLFVNNGKGDFLPDASALPVNYTSKSCIKASDFDNDGDLDLFIGGRCLPGKYPLPVSSFIYRNDSKNGNIKFTDITNEVCPDLANIGMVCDAIWTDFDNDGWTDMIVAGEWMPVTFLKNNHGKLENITSQSGISDQTGWWNSIAAGDFDNDGDIDYIAGNLGENSFLKASDQYPVSVYAKDFDKNGDVDAILTIFLKDHQGVKREFPAASRDDIMSQLPSLKKKFPTYKEFADADIHQIFTDDQLKGAVTLHATNFKSCYLENKGNGKFQLHELPPMAQMAPLNGMVVDDLNEDGNLDVAICGNDYGNEVLNGRYDAMNGLLLLGDGKGNFIAQTNEQSGFFTPGNAKALIKLRGADSSYLLAASQNRGPLKIFSKKNINEKLIPLMPADKYVLIKLANGKQRKEELYYGNSFLSQSARFVDLNKNERSIEIKDSKGNIRTINQ
jgi:hypothetical protein